MFNSNCMSPADMAAVMGTTNRGNDAFGGYGADMIICHLQRWIWLRRMGRKRRFQLSRRSRCSHSYRY